MPEIHFNRFVVVFNLTSTKPGRYDAFKSESNRLGRGYAFGPNWFFLKSPRPLDEVAHALAETIDKPDRLLVLELGHGKRPTRHRIAPLQNFSAWDKEFLESF